MGTVESWTNFERHNGGTAGARERFEVFCAELLDLANPGLEVHQIAANPGDGGIDVCVSHPDGIDIYQCKYFRDVHNGSRSVSLSILPSIKTQTSIPGICVCPNSW
jgi:hypothetical protein